MIKSVKVILATYFPVYNRRISAPMTSILKSGRRIWSPDPKLSRRDAIKGPRPVTIMAWQVTERPSADAKLRSATLP